ncbi:MAG: 3-hydroxyacyl-CoA dehydrogenase NAD-binding domain-containing protein [Solirubrobacteraceae bacterium]
MSAPRRIGVIGAGTMGAGIAQLAAQTGAHTVLHDSVDGALDTALAGIEERWARMVEKGRLDAQERDTARARLTLAPELDGLADCGLVIEAAPERLALKLELFGALTRVVADDAVLATNTSSLSVTEIAAGVAGSERVVGLHFFNPAPVMGLVEVVAGARSSAHALAVARAAGEAMGKRVIDAADVAGFLVNRVNRPFSLESLKLLEERVAGVATIDRVLRMAGGFVMGPFELMDMIGIDINHAVAESLTRASFGEPRYRPSPLAARMVAAGTLGRKTGIGWYAHPEGRPQDPEPLMPGGGDGRPLAVLGDDALASRAAAAGWDVGGAGPWMTVDCLPRTHARDARSGPVARLLRDGSLHALEPTAAGFHYLAPLNRLIEVTRTGDTDPEATSRLNELATTLGCVAEPVGDSPGLITGRVVCQLINEAAFLLGEGNGSADDVDAGMELGVGHPRGPIAWSRLIGLDRVVATLDALHAELGDPRYRVAPLLRQRAAVGATLTG